jgi:hypothetical protein
MAGIFRAAGSINVVLAAVETVKELLPIFRVLLAAPAVTVRLSLTVRVFPSAMVNVAPVAGRVIVRRLMVVAFAAPRVGAINVGEFEYTKVLFAAPVVPVAEAR